jgi:hypothetical protein
VGRNLTYLTRATQPHLPHSSHVPRLSVGALARPCTILVVPGPAPKFCCRASRMAPGMAPSKVVEDKDNPLRFSGEVKDWEIRE